MNVSVKDLRPIGDVLDVVKNNCYELYELHRDNSSAAAKGWIDDLVYFTNFGGRAKNASLRDEVLIVANSAIRDA